MKNKEEVAVLVQARLSSERCPRKMIRPFAGTTLTDICIEKLLKSNTIPKENIYLSVNEPELVSIGKKWGVNIFKRSRNSAKWDGGPQAHISVMYEWWDKIPHKYVVLVNACVPTLQTKTIDSFFDAYCSSEKNGMFGVMEKMNYFWNDTGTLLTPGRHATMNTKNVQKTFEAAHCLYAGKISDIGRGIWMGDFKIPGSIELFPMHEKECFDVDYEWQLKVVEAAYQAMKKEGVV